MENVSAKGFMFDTMIFNRILDNDIKIKTFSKNYDFYITHIQHDELANTKDVTRKQQLLRLFKQKNQIQIPTESVVLDISRFNMAKFGDGTYEKIKLALDSENKKPNNIQDALMAETAIKNGLILVTDDTILIEVIQQFNGEVVSFKSFVSGNY